MKNAPTIYKAGVEALPTISELANKIWPATYKDLMAPDQLEYMMDLFYSDVSLKEQFTKHSFIIISTNNEPVGFASYSPSYTDKVYKLHKIYVSPSIQGHGLGRTMIHFIMKELKAIGATSLDLNVKRDNKAKMFYEKLGFEVTGEEDIDIGHGYWMRDYVMRKHLND